MSQHDYDIANQTTPLFRADLNNALQALSSQSAGATAPSPTYANMTWYDTANNLLKMRSEADDAWITIGTLDQSANTFTAALAGTPTAATATLGTNTTQLATTAFVQSALAEAPSSFNTSSYALYETSGTFLIPANYAAVVHALGAGGSGAAAGSSRTCVASGGGAGGSAVKYVTATGSDRTVSFTIGAGGAGASDFGAGAVAGNAGGTTTVTGTGISLSATGGGGGSGAVSTGTGELIAAGAAGGVHEIGAGAVSFLAAQRHGCTYAGQRLSSFGHHGHGRGLPGLAVDAGPWWHRAVDHHARRQRWADDAHRQHPGAAPARPQAGVGLLHGLSAWLHGHGIGRGCLDCSTLPLVHTRVL